MNKGIGLVADTIQKSDIEELSKWLLQEETPILTKNKLTLELENKWAKLLGTKYSVYVNSGSSAILLALAAFIQSGKAKNKKIVVPGLSWATDLSSPMLLGMEPLLCDCNLEDLSCDITHLEKIFKENDPAALILVSPLGLVPDMSKIVELCSKYNVVLFEDVCESMGSKYSNKHLGTFGLASFFSMYYGHHLSTIEGGFINTDDEELYDLMLMMRSHGWARDLSKDKQQQLNEKYQLSSFDSLFTFFVPGFNLRATDLQAFIGLRVIDRLKDLSKIRENNYLYYLDKVKGNKINLTVSGSNLISNFAFPVIHKNRNKIVQALEENNIQVRPLIAGNMGRMPMWVDNFGEVSLPNCELINQQGFYLPNHHRLTTQEIDRIVTIINSYE